MEQQRMNDQCGLNTKKWKLLFQREFGTLAISEYDMKKSSDLTIR